MKKSFSKIMYAGLALAICLMLAGCGKLTPEQAMAKAQESMENVSSMSYDMTMDMELSAEGESVVMSLTGTADYILDPMKMKLDMTMDMGELGSYDLSEYLVEEDGQGIIYIGMDLGDGSLMWSKQDTPDLSSISQYDAKASMDLYISSAESFVENGKEKVNDMDATRYDGVIKGDAIEKVIEESGISQQYAALGIDVSIISSMLSDMGDLPVSIWLADKTYVPVKYEIDMTEFMQSMMAQLTEQMEIEDIEINIGKVFMSMAVKQIDNVSDIVVPEEALNAAAAY